MKLFNFLYHNIGRGYISSFSGLSKEVWWLALITLVNRAGTMVIPFLSLYLTTDLKFSLDQVAWIMSAFGLGSIVGSWLGGQLADKIGFYRVMVASLFLSGILFILMQFITSFAGICLGIFTLMSVADMFSPAMYVALNTYSKPENKTRSVTLMRLAINLGFSAGPAIGGLIITKLNYHGLFWVDGLTCVMASFVLLSVLHPKKSRPLDDEVVEQPISAYSDKPFLVFFLAMVIFGTVFLQLLSTLPFYYKNGVGLSEFEIGMLMTMNGFLIFVVEMPLIKWLESSRYTKPVLLLLGIIMTSISFALLLPDPGIALVITSLIIFTFGEMIVFPFSNSFSLDRAKKGRKGEYMALYSVSFSVSHLIAHNLGFHLIDSYGFSNSWLIMFCLGTVGVVLLLFLRHMLKKESLHKA